MGYTKIQNYTIEQLMELNLNGTQYRIMLTVIRYTYGFNRPSHKFSLSFLAKAIKCDKRLIRYNLSKLIQMQLIEIESQYTYIDTRELRIGRGLISPLGEDKIILSTEDKLIPQEIKDIKKDIKEKIYEHFQKLWELYPVKKGKGGVSDTQKTKLYKISYEELVRAITRYKADIAKNKTDIKYVKHGSTFFNSGYVDYLDANYAEANKPLETTQEEAHEKLRLQYPGIKF